jgi:thymidylate synthase
MNKLDKQYTDLLQDILDNGVIKKDRTGTGTVSVFGRQIRHKMSDGFPLITTKKMYLKGIITELLWFLRGDTNIQWLCQNKCNIWVGDAYKRYQGKQLKCISAPKTLTDTEFIERIKTDDEFANKWGDLGKIYGYQWRNWGGEKTAIEVDADGIPTKWGYQGGVDQLQNLINDLRVNPDSRRLMVSAWNVADLPYQVLPPCHFGFQVYTKELTFEERWKLSKELGYTNADAELPLPDDKFAGLNTRDEILSLWEDDMVKGSNLLPIPKRAISLIWNQRSCDTFLGIPFNIASYGALLMLLGKIVNMVPDELICSLGDTHLYLNHIEQAKEQISRTSFPLPKLNINTEFWLTESGECGIGYLNHNLTSLLMGVEIDDFLLGDYVSHGAIKAPLSN